jgi:hypothetical protein
MTLNELLALNGIAFLREAYQLILERDIDKGGQNYYATRMLAGARKYEVISKLARSTEARKSGVIVPGMRKYLARQRWADLPIVGWFARQFYIVESNDLVSRQVRALQMQLAVEGLEAGLERRIPELGVVAGSPSHHAESVSFRNSASVLDVALRDDMSAEMIAIYALLKCPA